MKQFLIHSFSPKRKAKLLVQCFGTGQWFLKSFNLEKFLSLSSLAGTCPFPKFPILLV